MRLDEKHPLNQLVLRYLEDRKRIRFNPEPIIYPDNHSDPYIKAGSHPEIVERLWDNLGSSLPVDCRALVYGTPALVHPVLGVVFALGYGTAYAIRIPNESIQEALVVGCMRELKWSDGEKTLIEEELGKDWVFGSWAAEEKQWLAQVYFSLSDSDSGVSV